MQSDAEEKRHEDRDCSRINIGRRTAEKSHRLEPISLNTASSETG